MACTLSPRAYESRRRAIETLAREALVCGERRGRSLRLRYRGEASDRVRALARLEAACCAFLAFEVRPEGEYVDLVITVPEHTAALADDVFAPFLPPGQPAPADPGAGA